MDLIKKSMQEAESTKAKNHEEISAMVKHYQDLVTDTEHEIISKVTDVSLQSAMKVNNVMLMVENSFQQVLSSALPNGTALSSITDGSVGEQSSDDSVSTHTNGEISRVDKNVNNKKDARLSIKINSDKASNQDTSDIASYHYVPQQMQKKQNEISFNANEIVKSGILLKQSGKTKEFVECHFVLRRGSLLYFYDKADFDAFIDFAKKTGEASFEAFKAIHLSASASLNNNTKHFNAGAIYFLDVSTPAGTACAALPSFLAKILYQQYYVFCIFTDAESIFIAASTKEILQSWIDSINESYNALLQGYNQQIQAIMESAVSFGGGNLLSATGAVMKSRSAKDVVPELLHMLDDQFAKEAQMIEIYYRKLKIFEAWKMLSKARLGKE